MDFIEALYPDMEDGSMLPAFGLGAVLFLIVSLLNIVAIRRKVGNIWKRKELLLDIIHSTEKRKVICQVPLM